MDALPGIEEGLPSMIGRIAAVIGGDHFPAGDRAALRRSSPGKAPPLVFYRFALRYLPEQWATSPAGRQDWMTLVAGIALMSPNAHHPGRRLGKVLAEAGYAEGRLERLLAAPGDTRRTLLLRAARFLAGKSLSCNWVDCASLLLTRDENRREDLHRRIAADFYTVLRNQ